MAMMLARLVVMMSMRICDDRGDGDIDEDNDNEDGNDENECEEDERRLFSLSSLSSFLDLCFNFF